MPRSRSYTAAVTTTQAFVDKPGYDQQMPGNIIYYQGFETTGGGTDPANLDNWLIPASYGATVRNGRNALATYKGDYSMNSLTGNSFPPDDTYVYSRTIAGLTVGRTYSFSAVATWPGYDYQPHTFGFAVGVAGIGSGAPIPFTTSTTDSSPVNFFPTYTFTATATSHVFQLRASTPVRYNSGQLPVWDEIYLREIPYLVHVPDHQTPAGTKFALDVSSGSVMLDETSLPYGNMTMTVAIPKGLDFALVTAALDARLSPRIALTVDDLDLITGLYTTRTFDMFLKGRTIDPAAGTVDIDCATDDALLTYFRRSATIADSSFLAQQASVKAITNSVLTKAGIAQQLDASSADSTFQIIESAQNLATNPRLSLNLTNWTSYVAGTSAALTRGTNAGAAYPYNTYARLQFGSGATKQGGLVYTDAVEGGQVYSVQMALNTTKSGGNTGQLGIRFYDAAGNDTGYRKYSAIGTITNAWSSLSIAGVKAPPNAASIWIEGYPGGSGTDWASGDVLYGTAVRISPDATAPDAYFDGDAPAAGAYTYSWDGGTGASTSTRTAAFERPRDNLYWQPGDSAWDFLGPILASAGLTLFCDEQRVWRLIGQDYTPPGQLVIAPGSNLFAGATDNVSRDNTAPDGSPLFFDAALVKYSWTDSNGNSRTANDAYAAPGSQGIVNTVEINRPFPGPGVAKYIVSKAVGRGRQFNTPSEIDWTATPAQSINLTFPFIDALAGFVSTVTWSLDDDDMSTSTRGLVQAPPTAWIFEAAGLSWDALPAGSSWTNG